MKGAIIGGITGLVIALVIVGGVFYYRAPGGINQWRLLGQWYNTDLPPGGAVSYEMLELLKDGTYVLERTDDTSSFVDRAAGAYHIIDSSRITFSPALWNDKKEDGLYGATLSGDRLDLDSSEFGSRSYDRHRTVMRRSQSQTGKSYMPPSPD